MTDGLILFYHVFSGVPRREFETKYTEKDFNELLTAIVLFYQNN